MGYLRLNLIPKENRKVFDDSQSQASKWCKVDHVHGPQCRQDTSGCSHDRSKVRWKALRILIHLGASDI